MYVHWMCGLLYALTFELYSHLKKEGETKCLLIRITLKKNVHTEISKNILSAALSWYQMYVIQVYF